MKLKSFYILVAVLTLSTAIYTIFVLIPNTKQEEVNTQVYAVLQTPIREDKENEIESNPLENLLTFQKDGTYLVDFTLLNRQIPKRWEGKKIYFKYTYLGGYTQDMVETLNGLLLDDYKWQRQLDGNRDIVLGGPIFLRDNIYQLHTHNGLSLANKHYLFGDLLHLLYSNDELEGTQIKVGEVILEAVWTKDAKVLEDNSTPSGANLIISTCLERDGDRRLISGWVVTLQQD